MTSTASPTTLVVTAPGTPAPQGSKKYVGHRAGKPVLVESCAALATWRKAVVLAAKSTMAETGPAEVTIDFYLPRPVSAPASRMLPDRRPDLDKLVRAVLDALTTAAALEDDARVVTLTARKHYKTLQAGALIRVAWAAISCSAVGPGDHHPLADPIHRLPPF